jgi:hypothetical protein
MIILKKLIRFLVVACLFGGSGVFTACNSSKAKMRTNESPEIHQVTIHKSGSGTMYVDKIPCNAVMQNGDTGSGTTFHCYLVGFIDSLSMAKVAGKKEIEAERYYQLNVQRDWTALQQGDSLQPVFYQPKQRLESHRHEGVLVFETASDDAPATLVYKDSYSMWGVQQVIVNSNKK